jgi:hypothetical protein
VERATPSTAMSAHDVGLGDDILGPSHTDTRLSSPHASSFFLPRSPIASRCDESLHHANDESFSAQTCPTLEGTSYDMDIYNTSYLGTEIGMDMEHMWTYTEDGCGDATSTFGHPAGGDFAWMADGTSHIDYPWEPHDPEAHVYADLGSWSTYCNIKSSRDSQPRSISSWKAESPTCDDFPDLWPQTSPSMDEQGELRFDCSTTGPHMAAMQSSDRSALISCAAEEGLNGTLGDKLSPDMPGVHGTTIDSWNVKFEPQNSAIEATSQTHSDATKLVETGSRAACPQCFIKFSHGADLTRHTRTKHGLAGTGYRCAFPECQKVHKVWSRLDSFKKHVRKQHHIEKAAEIDRLVKKSATGDHGLPIAMTSLFKMQAGSSTSRLRHSVTL